MTKEEEEAEFTRVNKIMCDAILANWLDANDKRWKDHLAGDKDE